VSHPLLDGVLAGEPRAVAPIPMLFSLKRFSPPLGVWACAIAISPR